MPTKKTDPLKELKQGHYRPVYAIDGEERVLVDDALRRIKGAVDDRSKDFNFDVFSGKEAVLERVVDSARTLPVFAPRRLVVVEQADKLNLEGSEALLAYLKDPNPTTVLVFVADKFDARTKVYKALTKAGAALRFSRPKPREMAAAIRSRAEAMGIDIDPRAIRALEAALGTDLSQATQALEVLSLYVGVKEKRPIIAEDVEQVVSKASESSIFALTDAIGNQDKKAVLEGLFSLLQVSREPPLRILAMIARHTRQLLKARAGLDAGASQAAIQSALNIPPYFVGPLLKQAQRQSLETLAKGLSAVAATDRSLKGGPLPGDRALERLALNLLHVGAPKPHPGEGSRHRNLR